MTSSDDQKTLAMVRTMLDRAHLATPGQLPSVVREGGRQLGWTAMLYLVDPEQELLIHAPESGAPTRPAQGVDNTLAGRCFRTVEPVASEAAPRTVWVPVVDGVERLGVLEVQVDDEEAVDVPRLEERCRLLGHLTGHLIAAKRPYGDGLDHLVQRQPRTVASELLRQLLPPLTFACEGLVISGLLQPYYGVAADAFDYSVIDDTAHLAVLDAMGHDLRGTTLAAIALSAYRNSRRQGRGVFASAHAVDELVAAHGEGWRYATGVLGELNLTTGRLRYLNAGHPPPLLLRRGKVVKELTEGRRVIFGLGSGEATIAEEWLEPGDRLVLYTDGITEARTPGGELFGLPRLIDHLQRAAATRQPAPEALRRISHHVARHQDGHLVDDATLLIAEWATGAERELTSSSTGDDATLSPSAGRPGEATRRS